MHNIEIIPALMPKTMEELVKKLSFFSEFAKSVQIDVVDGVFDDDITWPYVHDEQWKELVNTKSLQPGKKDLVLEAHLMVQKPRELGHLLLARGVQRLIAHAEVFNEYRDMGECLHEWRVAGAEIGMSLLLGTPLERIAKIVREVDVVQVMGIAEIGAQGHAFDPRAHDRIRELRLAYPQLTIEVDGGVNERNIHGLMLAGVNRCVVGSAIVRAADPARAYRSLREMIA